MYKNNKDERCRINGEHIKNGVDIWDVENTYIAPEVKIEKGAVIMPGCIIEGETHIMSGAEIGPNTKISNSVIGEGTDVAYSVVKDSKIGAGTHVGPFAYLRPGSQVGDGCKVGDFVEIKNATLGNGTKASHLTYIGDATVGEKVNFGCGTVIVNYDGKKKYITEIGDNVFVGCNSNLVSPVVVEDNSYIAAGSTITDRVPEKTLAIARARQVIKENWKDKREVKE